MYAIYDLTTTYQITDRFALGLNAVTGWQTGAYQLQANPYATGTFVPKSTNWGGVAVYANYALTSKFGIGGRYDFFDNTGGARALVAPTSDAGVYQGVTVTSVTITGNLTLADGHVLLKPEFRTDSYNKAKFLDADNKLTKSQTTLGMAAIFKF